MYRTPKRTITSMRENAHTQAFAVEFSRKRDYGPSTLRTFVRLKVLDCKRAEQSRFWLPLFSQTCVKTSSVFNDWPCEDQINRLNMLNYKKAR